MSRVAIPAVDSATGVTADLFSQIKKAVGKVPNTFAVIGALGPAAALKAVLQADKVLAGRSLTMQDQETIKLLVSELAGCDYCAAAHTQDAKSTGLTPQVMRQIRAGQPTGDARRDGLVHLVGKLVKTSGTISDQDFSAIKAAGWSFGISRCKRARTIRRDDTADTPNLSLRRLAMTTSTTVKALSGSLPAAFAIVALAVFSAGAHAATPGQITIYGSTTNTVGRDYAINAPIRDTTVKVGVSYDPGTLTTKSGIERLNDSVRDAARKACEIADPFTPDDETCIRQAIDSAQPQIARAIAQARTSTTGS